MLVKVERKTSNGIERKCVDEKDFYFFARLGFEKVTTEDECKTVEEKIVKKSKKGK